MDARQRQILDYLFNNSKSSHADISASVGIAVRQVHRHLAVLRAQNLIYRGGWDKDTSGAYRVVLWSVGNEPDAPRPYSKPRTAIPAQLSARAAKRANVDSQPTEPIQSKPPTKEGITFDVTTFNLLPDSVKQSVNNMVQTLAQEFSYGYR